MPGRLDAAAERKPEDGGREHVLAVSEREERLLVAGFAREKLAAHGRGLRLHVHQHEGRGVLPPPLGVAATVGGEFAEKLNRLPDAALVHTRAARGLEELRAGEFEHLPRVALAFGHGVNHRNGALGLTLGAPPSGLVGGRKVRVGGLRFVDGDALKVDEFHRDVLVFDCAHAVRGIGVREHAED